MADLKQNPQRDCQFQGGLRFGSVCSGIEAASVAWEPLGWRASFLSEIDRFPRAVLAHHYPEVPLHGDFTSIEAGQYDPIDVLVGGTPCQSFSVAGLRGGLADGRGNLALEYLKLAQRLGPKWLVWENVPGVLSSAGGRDFGSILGGLVELGYGFAYRVLDAQYFGVPQRRRRVFVVGYLGDWRRAAAVLFERDCLSGNPAPRREAGQRAAPTISARTEDGGGLGTDFDLDGGLISHCLNAGGMGRYDYETETETFIPILEVGKGTLSRGAGPNGVGIGNDGDPMYALQAGAQHAVAYNITPSQSNKDYNARASNRAQAVTSGGNRPSARGGDVIAFTQNQRDEVRELSVAGAIAAEPGMKQQTYVATDYDAGAFGEVDQASPLTTSADRTRAAPLVGASAVRRLTPRECERLQGFPDDYTLIQHRGKPAADGPRYKALGNSMAVPVMRWIGERIAMVEALQIARAA
jgi:DNA (cytosine-5)-methyltransferase 1